MEFEFDKRDLEDVKRLVTSDKFTQFLLSNTTSFGVAGFILQAVFDKIEAVEKEFGIIEENKEEADE